MKKKRFKKTKIFIGILYICILAIYAFILFGKFLPNEHREDLNFFGNSIYILNTNEAVSVDYSELPKEGDNVVCVINGKTMLATVDSIGKNKTLMLSANVEGKTQYFTTSYDAGVVTNIMPTFGKIYVFLNSIWGIIFIIIIPCSIFLIYEIIQLIKILKNKHNIKNIKNELANQPYETNSNFNYPNVEQKNEQSPPIETYNFNNNSTIFERQKFPNNNITNNKNYYEPTNNYSNQNGFLSDFNKENINRFLLENNTLHQAVKTNIDFSYIEPHKAKYTSYSLGETLNDLKYKMAFQDTNQVENKLEKVIGETNDEIDILKRYGLKTKNIDDGVEINITPELARYLTLQLKNDGSLIITTDNYIANIELDV